MIAFWCFSSIGLLMSLQYRCQREYEKSSSIHLREQERRLDEENLSLDFELAGLLQEHRRLVEGGG